MSSRIGATESIYRKLVKSFTAQTKWIAAAFLMVLFFTFVYGSAYRYFVEFEYARAATRIVFYRAKLESFLKRYQQLPYILAKDPRVIAGAEGRSLEELNTRLEDFSRRAGLEAIFLMDVSGRTIAASNADAALSFVGQSYGFRPYFKDARSGRTGQYFAVGTTTARPGYFIAEAVRASSGNILGVIAIKLDLLALQDAWQNHRDSILVSDGNDIVILASHKRWLYRAINPLPQNRRIALRQSRQYGPHKLDNAAWIKTGPQSISFENQSFLYTQLTFGKPGWTLHLLSTAQRASERAISVSIITGAVFISLLALAAFLRSKRVRAALLASEQANARLSAEIEERNALERRLAKAQAELQRKDRLATLGQLSAFVTHELGQPIAALKTYIVAEELRNGCPLEKQEKASDSLKPDFIKNVKSISERMDGITRQLRLFAQGPEPAREAFDLRELEASVVGLVQHDIDAHAIAFKSNLGDEPLIVAANRLRLEQVLVNLIANAISAVEGQPQRNIKLSMTRQDKHALITVTDTGVGLAGATLEDLQEPFFSTRKSGKGLGLGLAIVTTIVCEHGGSLDATAMQPEGACFHVRIPLTDGPQSEGPLNVGSLNNENTGHDG